MGPYGYFREVSVSIDQVLKKLSMLIENAGFIMLYQVEMGDKIKEKLGIDFPRYKIIGVCNVPNAHRMINAEPETGLFVTCTIVVYEKDQFTGIGTIRPSIAMSMIKSGEIREIALFLENKLKDVIDSI